VDSNLCLHYENHFCPCKHLSGLQILSWGSPTISLSFDIVFGSVPIHGKVTLIKYGSSIAPYKSVLRIHSVCSAFGAFYLLYRLQNSRYRSPTLSKFTTKDEVVLIMEEHLVLAVFNMRGIYILFKCNYL